MECHVDNVWVKVLTSGSIPLSNAAGRRLTCVTLTAIARNEAIALSQDRCLVVEQ